MLPQASASSVRKKRNFKGLQLNESPLSTPKATLKPVPGSSGLAGSSSEASVLSTPADLGNGSGTASSNEVEPTSGANYHNKLSEQLATLELGIEYKLDLKNEDLTTLSELGAGNGGTVTKVSSFPSCNC